MSAPVSMPAPPPPPPAAAAETTNKNVEPLAVRVMRLSKPALYQSMPIYAEESSSSSTAAFLAGQSQDVAIGNENSLMSNLLVLPYSFGNVFLGETFSSIVSLHNQSEQTLRDVVLKTDIQTATQRIPLNPVDQSDSNKLQLTPDQSICRVLQHEVKELGNHSLVCTVSCIDQAGEKCNLKKVFKLPVGKPIELRTRFVQGAQHDEYYVVADIQNQTPSILYMMTVELEPTAVYTVTNLNNLHHGIQSSVQHSESSLCEPWRFLRPTEMITYMFHLQPRKEIPFEQAHSTNTLGKLDIVWISGLGERGRLQTNQLPKPTPSIPSTNLGYLPDLRVSLIDGQGTCHVEEAQRLKVRISNCTERTMDLALSFDPSFAKREAFLWTGVATRQLGKLDTHATRDIEIDLVPLTSGLKRIGGLKLTDLSMRRTYDLEDFHNLFVLPKVITQF